MATHPVVVVDHGRVDIPKDLQGDPRFQNGARLQLVPVPARLGVSSAMDDAEETWENFLSLGGILAQSSFDPNAELEAEKQRELKKEAW